MGLLKNLRVRTRLTMAFALLMGLLLAMAAVGTLLARSINHYAEFYAVDIVPSLSVIHHVDGAISDVRRLEHQHLLTDDYQEKKALVARIAKAREDLQRDMKAYEPLVVDDEDRALMRKVGDGLTAYFKVHEQVLKASEESASDPTQGTAARELTFGASRAAFTPVREAVEDWWRYNDRLATATTEAAGAAYQRVQLIFALASLAAVVIGVVAALSITRSITVPVQRASDAVRAVADGDLTQRIHAGSRDELGALLEHLDRMTQSLATMVTHVREGCDQLNLAADEIAQGNADLSARTESQASSLEETAASVEQMTAQIKANADNARQADQLASRASEVAQAGGSAVGEVVSTMDEISQSSRRISDIIGTIDGIAFQTNILALNAAVEAARAGEQGRGFAVVASEVRSLAQRSAEAAKEIKSLIGDSVGKVNSGSEQVLGARTTIDQMVSEVRKVTDLVAEITASSREQAEGVGQINAAVSQLDHATQQNAALVEQTAAAAESMRQQTRKLGEAVAAFRVNLRPSGQSVAPAGRAARSTTLATARPAPRAAANPQPAPAVTIAPLPKADTPRPLAAARVAEDSWETF